MFWKRFYDLCIKNGTKPSPLGSKIGISSGVITKWKNGTIPNGETLIRLADEFECSIDYLLGRTDETFLNEKEKRLISAYRDQPNIQLAVDRLLGIDASLQMKNNEFLVAAAGGDKKAVTTANAETIGALLDEIENRNV